MLISDAWTELKSIPLPSDAEALNARWEQWDSAASSCSDESLKDRASQYRADDVARALFESVFGNSPFLSHCLLSDVEFAARLVEEGPDKTTAAILADTRDMAKLQSDNRRTLMKRLRLAKSNLALALALADITSVWDVMKTTRALSDFAAATLHASCGLLLREESDKGKLNVADPTDPNVGSGLIVLGMGKLGAGELNYSSDVDLILLFDEETAPVADGWPQPLFSRLARNLVTVMAKRTEDGYVFRTDLRLRPDPNSTPPAVSTRAAETYYRTVGQTWERAAMIKANPIAGDFKAAERFMTANEGFVWRRNLDFASMRDIQAAKRQINAHRGSKDIDVEGHNVKLGRGGIREIEFFTQSQQLIWGGQNNELRGRETLSMLDLLARTGRITLSCAADLKSAYKFLRRVEHRVQMTDDQQTHSLPETREGVERLATFLGYPDRDAFASELIDQLETVQLNYNELLENRPSSGTGLDISFDEEQPGEDNLNSLRDLGFEDAEAVWKMIRNWHQGEIRATSAGRSREMVIELTPSILGSFSTLPEPDAALLRFNEFLAGLSQSVNLFAILNARPDLLALIADIMGTAPELSNWLKRSPNLLESALQRDFEDLELPEDLGLEREMEESARRGLVRLFYKLEFGIEEMIDDLKSAVEKAMPDGFDFQNMLDVQRRWVQQRKFQVGVHMLRGYLTPVQASEPLSGIAQANVSVLLEDLQDQFAQAHGKVPGGKLAVLAFGKLGSRELTLASDLDLIFVYEIEPDAAMSDGAKALSPTAYYARFCRRFISGLTAPTNEGRPYEVDMRLRPSGKSGPIACMLETFESYQREKAWTWEILALTKARVIYSEGDLGQKLEGIFKQVLTSKRDPAAIKDDILDMRRRIDEEFLDSQGASIKYRHGGLMDLEMIAQYLQIRHAAEHPDILRRDSISVFEKAGELGLVDKTAAAELAEAAVFWRNLQGMLILTAGDNQSDDNAASQLKRSFGRNYSSLMFETFADDIQRTAELVKDRYARIIGT